MIYLLLAIAGSVMVSLCIRMSEKYVHNNMVMFTVNYAVCLALARFYMGEIHLFTSRDGITRAVLLGTVNGILFLANFIFLQKCILHNGVILSSVAMKLGAVLLPTLAAVLLFHEHPEWTQVIGILIALAAIVLINLEKGSTGKSDNKFWLFILLVGSGITDTMSNVYDKTGAEALKDHFLFYTFFAALVLAFLCALLRKQKIERKDMLWGVLLGIPNYFSARFLLLALGSVPAVVTYPVYSVGTIIVISIIGAMVFGEKLNAQKKLALGLILAALVLLNI